MALNSTHEYDDILNYSRPVPAHPRMSRENRAKIFSPFAALRGYGDVVEEKKKIRTNKLELSEEMKAQLNEKLLCLTKHQKVTITYFHHNPGSDGSGGMAEGEYRTVTGEIEGIEPAFSCLKLSSRDDTGVPVTIYYDDIYEVDSRQSQ